MTRLPIVSSLSRFSRRGMRAALAATMLVFVAQGALASLHCQRLGAMGFSTAKFHAGSHSHTSHHGKTHHAPGHSSHDMSAEECAMCLPPTGLAASHGFVLQGPVLGASLTLVPVRPSLPLFRAHAPNPPGRAPPLV